MDDVRSEYVDVFRGIYKKRPEVPEDQKAAFIEFAHKSAPAFRAVSIRLYELGESTKALANLVKAQLEIVEGLDVE